jgi:ribonuclease HI
MALASCNARGASFSRPSYTPELKLKTANTHALFESLLSQADYLGTQEEESDGIPAINFRQGTTNRTKYCFPSAAEFFNPATKEDPGGGTAIRILVSWSKLFRAKHHIIVPGRIHMLELLPKETATNMGPIGLVNGYLTQGKNWPKRTNEVHLLANFLEPFSTSHFLHMSGDWNHVENPYSDVCSTSSKSGSYWHKTGPFKTEWARLVKMGFLEVHQPHPTHWQSTAKGGFVSAKLDRHYSNAGEADYTAHDIKAWLPNTPFTPLSTNTKHTTDHQPVMCRYTLRSLKSKEDKALWVPDRVLNDSNFVPLFKYLWSKRVPATSPARLHDQFLRIVKTTAQSVAKKQRNQPNKKVNLLSLATRLYRLLKSAPLSLREYGEVATIIESEESFKDFVIPIGECHFDTSSLRDHINEIYKNRGSPAGASPKSDDTHIQGEEGKPKLKKNFNRTNEVAAILPSSRRRLTSLKGPDDEAISTEDPDEMVGILKDFWGGTIWSSPTSHDASRPLLMERVLAKWGKKIRTPIKRPSLSMIKCSIKKFAAKNSASGIDGMPFKVYERLSEVAAPILLGVTKELGKKNCGLPLHFNEGLTVFGPKEDSDRVDKLRPITIGTSGARIAADTIRQACTESFEEILDPDQYGFLKGRVIDDVITHFNEEFHEARERGDSYFLYLQDTMKAFDSLFHDYLLKLLEAVGCPEWFVNTVKNLFKDLKVKTTVPGAVNVFIIIARGVKQGCPLAPLLFILAFDVYLSALKQAKRAWADDNSMVLKNLEEELKQVSEWADVFARVAGLATHKDKTLVIPAGKITPDFVKKVKAAGFKPAARGRQLGVQIGHFLEPQGATRLYLEDIFKPVSAKVSKRTLEYLPYKSKIAMWRRIYFANTRLVSMYRYLMRFYTPPERAVKDLKTNAEVWLGGGQGHDYSADIFSLPKHLLGFRQPLVDLVHLGTATLSHLWQGEGNDTCLDNINKKFSIKISDHRAGAVAACIMWELDGQRCSDDRFSFYTPVGGEDTAFYYDQLVYSAGNQEAHMAFIRKKWEKDNKYRPHRVRCLEGIDHGNNNRCVKTDDSILRTAFHLTCVHRKLDHYHWVQLQITLGILNLADRRAGYKEEDPTCRLCRDEDHRETLDHVFYPCHVVREALKRLVHLHGVHESVLLLEDYNQAALISPFFCKIWSTRTVAINQAIYSACERNSQRNHSNADSAKFIADQALANLQLLPELYLKGEGISWVPVGGGCPGAVAHKRKRRGPAPQITLDPNPYHLNLSDSNFFNINLPPGTITLPPLPHKNTLEGGKIRETYDKVSRIKPGALVAYLDGSARPNPGPGGAGATVLLPPQDTSTFGTIIVANLPITQCTNNIGEIAAFALGGSLLITVLEDDLTGQAVEQIVIFSDSRYAIDMVNYSDPSRFKENRGIIYRAIETMRRLQEMVQEILVIWVPSHTNIPGNELADVAAGLAAEHAISAPGWNKHPTSINNSVEIFNPYRLPDSLAAAMEKVSHIAANEYVSFHSQFSTQPSGAPHHSQSVEEPPLTNNIASDSVNFSSLEDAHPLPPNNNVIYPTEEVHPLTNNYCSNLNVISNSDNISSLEDVHPLPSNITYPLEEDHPLTNNYCSNLGNYLPHSEDVHSLTITQVEDDLPLAPTNPTEDDLSLPANSFAREDFPRPLGLTGDNAHTNLSYPANLQPSGQQEGLGARSRPSAHRATAMQGTDPYRATNNPNIDSFDWG